MTLDNTIKVTSHVSRDFLQNSQYFNTHQKLIWEYVSNSLDAAVDGTEAVVEVKVDTKRLVVNDNGSGMSREELSNFFTMHGENLNRKKGKRVRGRFGTGKSAAFGMANTLRVDTVKDGLRNVVELKRSLIQDASSGRAFPVENIIVNERSEEQSGTSIIITDFIQTSKPKSEKIRISLEKHLSRYRQRARVSVNGIECRFVEPTFTDEYKLKAPPVVVEQLGDIELTIRVSPTPLDDDTKGVDVLSCGIWHGSELGNVENKERANYLFGEVDVPIFEEQEWDIPPFDNTRNSTLNIQNTAVVTLIAWISQELEVVRKELIEREKQHRKSEEAKQLAKEAEQIASILNDDFQSIEMDFQLAQQIAKRSGNNSIAGANDSDGHLMPGEGDIPTNMQQAGSEHGNGKRGAIGAPSDEPRPGLGVTSGNELGRRVNIDNGNRKKVKSVFSIEYVNETEQSDRSRYSSKTKTIFINLDHPQVAKVFLSVNRNTLDTNFRQLCYEIAAIEYALAVPYEKIERDELFEASDALFDVKETINRITRKLTLALE